MITSGPIPSPAIAAILCARIVPPLPIGARNGYRARVSAAYISADKERKRVRARPTVLAMALLALLLPGGAAFAQKIATDELLSAVVEVKTFINPDGRTVEILGREREGSGVVIDDQGLVLTIGYLMVEAHAAQVATNDGH